MNKKTKIGISFSGGGTRATAHIGIIQALRENDIQINSIAGTSGGAIVGALYAAGLSTDDMLDFVARGKFSKLFRAKLPTRGLTSLDFLGDLLKEYLPDKERFEDLNTPLTVVASNLNSGQIAYFNNGALFPAIMASCAIPLMFKPIKIGSDLYVDGGIFDNMPVAPLQKDCDFIIGANVMPIVPLASKKLESVFSISMRSFNMIVAHNSQINFPHCNIVIEPTKTVYYGIFNFSATKELFDIGYEKAMDHIKEIKSILPTI